MSSRRERRKKRAEAASLRAQITAAPTESILPRSGEAIASVEPVAPASLAPTAIDVHEADVAVVEARWTPEAFARRARFARYVGGALAACAVLLAVGVGMRYAQRSHVDVVTAARAPNATAVPTPPAAPAPPPETTPEPTPEPVVSAEDPAPAPDPSLARRAKRESQLALEVGKVGDAIEAGERSVALDPSDREAWLILGAAYQQKGAHEDARRCFEGCLRTGTRGETWQCAAMLR